MNKETKTTSTSSVQVCQNCKQDFVIEPEDFEFYEKIKVPAPTFCTECRLQRRLAWRNERILYKRKCDLCEGDVISVYPSQGSFKIYCSNCWYGDKWDGLDYSQNYNFSKPFFEQFKILQQNVPRLALANLKNIKSEYSNYAAENKNCYLLVSAIWNEDCYYGYRIFSSKDCFDCYDIGKCELCYGCIQCEQSYNSSFCILSENLVNCQFCYDCKNCQDCFGCSGLRNKSYCIFNKQYTKEEYLLKLKEFSIDSYINLLALDKKSKDFQLKIPRRAYRIINSKRCSGDEILFSKNCINCFSIKEGEDLKNIIFASEVKSSMDSNFNDHSELGYETMSVEQDYNFILGTQCWYSHDIKYSDLCTSCSSLFGCIGLRHKQYCILNKQYTKEEYEELISKIIQHMNDVPYVDKKGRVYKYGEFFPVELSPFAYNETVAQEYFPLAKEQALEKGYPWKKPEEKQYTITITPDKLPDHIKDVDDSILNEVIGCQTHKENPDQAIKQSCTTAFKIIPQELEFYKKMNLPLPRLCPNCRHYQRLKQRNPLKLWHRKCQCAGEKSDPSTSSGQVTVYKNTISHNHGKEHCPNEFETTYSSDRPEIVYCEKCYLAEVV